MAEAEAGRLRRCSVQSAMPASDAPAVSTPGHRHDKLRTPNSLIVEALPQPPVLSSAQCKIDRALAPLLATGKHCQMRIDDLKFSQATRWNSPLVARHPMMNETVSFVPLRPRL